MPYQLSSCYKFVASPKNWNQAERICRDVGGHLATFDTLEEIIWVKGYRIHNKTLHGGPLYGLMWIGGHKINSLWYWKRESHDDLINVTDWASEEPNNVDIHGRPEDCIGLLGKNSEINFTKWFHWNDAPCELTAGYICEKDTNL